MRILQWAFPHLPPLGGREIFVERLSRSLAEEQHNVLVMADAESVDAPLHEISYLREGIPIHRLNLDAFGTVPTDRTQPSIRKEIKSVIDDFAPDVIHFHNFYSRASVFLNAYLRSANRDIPTVYTIHDVETLSKIPQFLGGEIVGRMTSVIVCPSQYMYRRLESQKGILGKKVVVIENGVPEGNMARRDKGDIQILAAANFEVHKGLVVLLTAWSKIARDFPDVRLVVAGDGREKKFLLDYVTKLGISESVYFPGWLSENQLEKEFNRDAIVVVPSLIAEAFGLVAAEAQMAGLPVIASDIGGLNEIVKDGQTGFVIPAGQTSGLSEALTTLLGSSELRRKFGAAGRERAIELFGMQQCTAKYVELYQSLREEEG